MDIRLEKAYAITGWMSNSELEWLAKTARDCYVIIEFGCYLGRSTRALVDNTKGLTIAVDPWDGVYHDKNGNRINILKANAYEQFRTNLIDAIESRQLEILRCRSTEFPDNFGWNFADFVFIDADHRYEQVKQDIRIAESLVRKGGIIAGHDYGRDDWPGVKQAVDEVYPEARIVESIWHTVKK